MKILSLEIWKLFFKQKEVFYETDPILEIEEKLKLLNFDPNINYIGVYISRIKKDDPNPEKVKIYHKLKKILLEKNITSQVVYKNNIAVLYSKKIAEFTSSFDNNILPISNTAKKNTVVFMTLKSLFEKTIFIFGAGASKSADCFLSKEMFSDLKQSILDPKISWPNKSQFSDIYDFIIQNLLYQYALKDPEEKISDVFKTQESDSQL